MHAISNYLMVEKAISEGKEAEIIELSDYTTIDGKQWRELKKTLTMQKEIKRVFSRRTIPQWTSREAHWSGHEGHEKMQHTLQRLTLEGLLTSEFREAKDKVKENGSRVFWQVWPLG